MDSLASFDVHICNVLENSLWKTRCSFLHHDDSHTCTYNLCNIKLDKNDQRQVYILYNMQ